jgi:type II secretory ATPase GspE/PulE/Tfp pilus assembly ATPase PilB-like protein
MSRDVLTNPNMLTLLAYQALVPKVCAKCGLRFDEAIREELRLDAKHPGIRFEAPHLMEIKELLETKFKLPTDSFRFRNPRGCEHCSSRGTKGVTVVAEMLMPDRAWLEFTRVFKDYEAMVSYRMTSDGKFTTASMTGKTIFEHTLFKAFQGVVDPRQCQRFETFARFEIAPKLRPSDSK